MTLLSLSLSLSLSPEAPRTFKKLISNGVHFAMNCSSEMLVLEGEDLYAVELRCLFKITLPRTWRSAWATSASQLWLWALTLRQACPDQVQVRAHIFAEAWREVPRFFSKGNGNSGF